MRRLLSGVAKFLVAFVAWQALIRLARRWVHFPAPAFMGPLLDSPLRHRAQPPAQVLARSGVLPGRRVLEIGCGSGAFLLRAAGRVGSQGLAMGLDMQAKMLTQVRRKASGQLTLVCADALHLPLTAASFDVVYFVTSLPEMLDPVGALREAARLLRPGGLIAVTEFLPDPDYPGRRTTARWGRAAGLQVEAILGTAWDYTVRFRA